MRTITVEYMPVLWKTLLNSLVIFHVEVNFSSFCRPDNNKFKC